MKKFAIIIGALLILLLVAAFYVIVNKEKIVDDTTNIEINNEEVVEVDESNLRSLVVKHQYKDGKHIFMGDVEVPTPCHSLTASISDTSNPDLKRINITIGAEEGMCAQVITTKTFKVEYEGAEELKFEAYIGDERMRLNRFDVAPEVDIDEFELFIKG
jgi:hypothetical protein